MYRGLAHSQIGELEEALDCYREAQALEPDVPAHWLNVAHLELELGYAEEARHSYARAASLAPDDPEAAAGMTAAAFELGDVQMAARIGRRAVELDPDNPDALYNLGIIELSMGRVDDAEEFLERALAIDPSEVRYRMSLAAVLLRRGEVDDALELAQGTIDEGGENATILFEFCRDLLRFGGAEHLERFVERVDSLDPRWRAIRHVFEFMARALRRKTEDAVVSDIVSSFVNAVKEEPQIVPVLWNFDDLERLTLSLEQPAKGIVETMLAILEGRKEISDLEAEVA